MGSIRTRARDNDNISWHRVQVYIPVGTKCLLCLYVLIHKYVKHGREESLCIGSLDGSEFRDRECVFEFGDCIVTSFKWQYKNMLELEIYFQV